MTTKELPKLKMQDVRHIKSIVQSLRPRLYRRYGYRLIGGSKLRTPLLDIWDDTTFHPDNYPSAQLSKKKLKEYRERMKAEYDARKNKRRSLKFKGLASSKQQDIIVSFLRQRYGIEAIAYVADVPAYFEVPEGRRLSVRFLYERID